MPYTIAFETLGCRLNQAETAVFADQFMARGYTWVEDATEADLCIIHTCTLTSQATAKCRQLIRSIIRRNPDVCIAAVGCYAQTGADELRDIRGLDYIIGTSAKMRLPEIIRSPDKLPEPVIVCEKAVRGRFTIDGVGYYPQRTRANLKVQEGCNFVCSFCIIPKSRGPARSRDFNDILREARALVTDGHRELIVTGINVGTYEDRGRTLIDVVEALETIAGLDRIRLSSIEPTTIDTRLIDRMMDGTKVCPYLHVPMQSGDDGVLSGMRRKYTSAEYEKFIDYVLERIPEAGLGTDVIVGFPGETEEAFKRTCRLVERIPFNNIHVFSFSGRQGTGAYRAPDQVPADVIAERSRRLHRLADAKKRAFYEAQVGKELRVLFEERDSAGRMIGFSDNYVKVAVDTTLDLCNCIGSVRVSEVAGKPLRALGDLIAFEQEAAGPAARCSLTRGVREATLTALAPLRSATRLTARDPRSFPQRDGSRTSQPPPIEGVAGGLFADRTRGQRTKAK